MRAIASATSTAAATTGTCRDVIARDVIPVPPPSWDAGDRLIHQGSNDGIIRIIPTFYGAVSVVVVVNGYVEFGQSRRRVEPDVLLKFFYLAFTAYSRLS